MQTPLHHLVEIWWEVECRQRPRQATSKRALAARCKRLNGDIRFNKRRRAVDGTVHGFPPPVHHACWAGYCWKTRPVMPADRGIFTFLKGEHHRCQRQAAPHRVKVLSNTTTASAVSWMISRTTADPDSQSLRRRSPECFISARPLWYQPHNVDEPHRRESLSSTDPQHHQHIGGVSAASSFASAKSVQFLATDGYSLDDQCFAPLCQRAILWAIPIAGLRRSSIFGLKAIQNRRFSLRWRRFIGGRRATCDRGFYLDRLPSAVCRRSLPRAVRISLACCGFCATINHGSTAPQCPPPTPARLQNIDADAVRRRINSQTLIPVRRKSATIHSQRRYSHHGKLFSFRQRHISAVRVSW